MSLFEIVRADGRSNAQVLIDLVRDESPGRLYQYDELRAVLEEGTVHAYNVTQVRAIVIRTQPRMLSDCQRTLSNVRGVGYRLAHANDHQGLAVTKKRRADAQIVGGLRLLREVRWDELDQKHRQAHEGMLMVMEGIVLSQQALDRRQAGIELAIQRLTKKVEDIEKK